MRLMPHAIAAALATMALAAPASGAVPATGTLAGFPVTTTVDAEAAREVLAGPDPLPGPGGEDGLSACARDIVAASVDAQAICLVRSRLGRDARSLAAQKAFHAEMSVLRNGGGAREALRRLKIRFVPGFLHRRDPTTGADFARQIAFFRRAGLDAELIEVIEDGTVEENAEAVAAAIRGAAGGIVLVSSSKGSAEAALALSRLDPGERRRVRAWVSIGGLHRGTPAADDGLRWPKRWIGRLLLGGRAMEAVRGLQTAAARRRWREHPPPSDVPVLQLVGVPLSGQVDPRARGRWRYLSRFGPNDGATLIADELMDGSRAVFIPGLDHFFRDPEIDLVSMALANIVTDMAAEGGR